MISFFPLMTLIFVTLKLIGVIDWSWWWVTAPSWGFAILMAILFTPAILRASR